MVEVVACARYGDLEILFLLQPISKRVIPRMPNDCSFLVILSEGTLAKLLFHFFEVVDLWEVLLPETHEADDAWKVDREVLLMDWCHRGCHVFLHWFVLADCCLSGSRVIIISHSH